MKNAFAFLFLLVFTAARAQQSTLPGVVAVFNSQFETGKRAYVANAQVEEDYGRSQATVTGSDGRFRLPLIGVKDQEKVFYSVKKVGYEVVNADALQAVAGQLDTQRVFMAPAGQLAENKLKYYKINRQAAEKALTDKLQRLEKEILATQPDQVRLKPLQEEYGRLQAQFEKIEETARELADRYARTNLDDVSTDYQRAFRCFQRGQLDSALLIFQAADLEGGAAAILSEQGRNADLAAEYARRDTEKNRRKGETGDALRFKAQLHETRFEFERAEQTYRLLLRLDSTDIYGLWAYAYFLAQQNQHGNAVLYYEKCFALSQSEEFRASLLDNLGISYNALGQFETAEKKYLLSFEIFRSLAKTYPDLFESNLARVANNLGVCYFQNNQYQEAENKLRMACEIRERLANEGLEANMSDWAQSSNNLGVLYKDINAPEKAEKAYLLALEIRRQLADYNHAQYDCDLAQTASNLAILYKNKNQYDKAEKNYQLAFNIRQQLAKNNPARFDPDYAQSSSNLGNYYNETGDFFKAESNYILALELFARLAGHNPVQFEPGFAQVCSNAAGLYWQLNRLEDAEKQYLTAFSIFERMAKDRPEKFAPPLAQVAYNLGNFYSQNNYPFHMAEGKYLLAFEIRERLAGIYPGKYELLLANTANNIGAFYINNNYFDRSEEKFIRAFEIYSRLANENPRRFESDFAMAATNLGNLYYENNQSEKAEEKYLLAMKIREKLVSADSGRFELDFASTAYNFGVFYETQHRLTEAKDLYTKALNIYQKYILNEKSGAASDVIQTCANLGGLCDSFVIKKDYKTVVEIQRMRAASMESLALIDTSFTSQAIKSYGLLSWYLLFIKACAFSESAARRALELDSTQTWVNANLAHALLFQGKYQEAEKIYLNLKDKTYEQDPSKQFRDVCLEDLDTLEAAGITHPDLPKIRALLRQ